MIPRNLFSLRRSQRTDWRTERKLNSETFGVASTRRGGFRGRGYYNRGMAGGAYRGNNAGGPGGQMGGGGMNLQGGGAGGYHHRGNYRGNHRGTNPNTRNKQRGHAQGNSTGQNCEQNVSQQQQNNRLVTGTA